ncbi:MAG: hypothetical protein U0414_08375 [Polyangiaceae bacterium]
MAALREGNTSQPRSSGVAVAVAVVSWVVAGAVNAAPTGAGSASASAAPSATPPRAMSRAAALQMLDASAREAAEKLGLSPRQQRLRTRPLGDERVCDVLRRVCVHAGSGVKDEVARATLADAANALAGLEALRLLRPPSDFRAGGDPSFDVYVDPAETEGHAYVDVGTTDSVFDSGSTFVSVGPERRAGCAAPARIATLVAEAALLGLDSSTDPGVLEMSSRYLATLVAPCAIVEMGEVDTFQRAPERCLVSDGQHAQPGSFLFPQYLDEKYGAQGPGTLTASLVAISWQKALADKSSWPDEPDFFDGLRTTMIARGSDLGEVMLDFAVERAFLGSRSDEGHMIDVARFGDLGRPRLEWSVAYDSLPRRLLPSRPLDALGATYIWLDVSKAPEGATFTFEADWERPFLFRWSLVKVRKDGSEDTRIKVAPVFGEYEAARVVQNLGDLAGILIVGENDAEWSKSQPFDPGEPRLAPKSYGVTLRAGTAGEP